ncbi:hypothetical protein AAMO2058_000192900 [Amorphochlora amoebiformis]
MSFIVTVFLPNSLSPSLTPSWQPSIPPARNTVTIAFNVGLFLDLGVGWVVNGGTKSRKKSNFPTLNQQITSASREVGRLQGEIWIERETGDLLLREVDRLMEKGCWSIGNCRKKSIEWRYPNPNPNPNYTVFVIAFESSYLPGYHTEKLLNAIVANTVPAYFGHGSTVGKIFNPKRFIHCKFDVERSMKKEKALLTQAAKEDLRKCVLKIKEVDQNDTLWAMVSELVLPSNRIEGTPWDLRNISSETLSSSYSLPGFPETRESLFPVPNSINVQALSLPIVLILISLLLVY